MVGAETDQSSLSLERIQSQTRELSCLDRMDLFQMEGWCLALGKMPGALSSWSPGGCSLEAVPNVYRVR